MERIQHCEAGLPASELHCHHGATRRRVRKHIEKDAAWRGGFQTVFVDENSSEDTNYDS